MWPRGWAHASGSVASTLRNWPLVEVFEAFYVWELVMGPAVVPRREISVEENSAASLSLLEQLEHKFHLVQWTAPVKRRAGTDLSSLPPGFWSPKNSYSMMYNTAVSPWNYIYILKTQKLSADSGWAGLGGSAASTSADLCVSSE